MFTNEEKYGTDIFERRYKRTQKRLYRQELLRQKIIGILALIIGVLMAICLGPLSDQWTSSAIFAVVGIFVGTPMIVSKKIIF